MSIQVKIFLSIFAVILLANCLAPVQAGLRTWLCPPNENVLNATCQKACALNHNALYGWCGKRNGDYNCYCSPSLPVSSEPNMEGTDCADANDARHDVNCRLNCQCLFNAQSGYCDFHQRACNCVGQTQNPTTNNFCPFGDDVEAFFLYREKLNLPGRSVPIKGPLARKYGYNNSYNDNSGNNSK